MLLWRVEDGGLIGVYSCTSNVVKEARCQCVHVRSPTPSNDPGMSEWWEKFRQEEHWFFAFASLGQFHHWFHTASIRRGITSGEMQLNRYDVPDAECVVGEQQVCFLRANALLVETRRPDYAD